MVSKQAQQYLIGYKWLDEAITPFIKGSEEWLIIKRRCVKPFKTHNEVNQIISYH